MYFLGLSGRHMIEYVFRQNFFITGQKNAECEATPPSFSLRLQQTSSKSGQDKWLQITQRAAARGGRHSPIPRAVYQTLWTDMCFLQI